MPARLATLAAAALLALVAAMGVSASSFVPDPIVQVSGVSPFAGCTADAGQPGIAFVNSEVEPWIDVHPTNQDNLAGIWQQDRWDNGGARGFVAGRSLNGGAAWATAPITGLTKCAGGAYDRATDRG